MKPIKLKWILPILMLAAIVGCSSDDNNDVVVGDPFVAAFETLSARLGDIDSSLDVPLVYSVNAPQNGTITISISATNASYGTDFSTVPAGEGNTIEIPVSSGSNGATFTFNKLNPSLDETTQIQFSITAIDVPNSNIQGNTNFLISNSASLGRAMEPEVGGPNQDNQVYIDLSAEATTTVKRDNWDLSFYSGNEFRVGLNASIYMAAGAVASTDIDAVDAGDVADLQALVAVGTFDPLNAEYIDNPNGAISQNAMGVVSENDAENPVYLVNMGFEVGTEIPEPGSTVVAGDPRGWKKIRVLREGEAYRLQYADLNDISHQEVVIEKSGGYNFSFFSFNTNNTLIVEPAADRWDICFTVFTNILEGAGSYGFSDGVLHNRKGGVSAYQVNTSEFDYESFGAGNVVQSNFQQDQRAIGAEWRDVFEGVAFTDRFFVLKDPNNNIYKIKFLSMLNDGGLRGYPEFEYELLQ